MAKPKAEVQKEEVKEVKLEVKKVTPIPRDPYVKFWALWTTLKDGNQVPDHQEVYYNVESMHTAQRENILNLMEKGWTVLSYGNFPKNKHYNGFAAFLDNMCIKGNQKPVDVNAMKESLRAEILKEMGLDANSKAAPSNSVAVEQDSFEDAHE